MVKHVAAAVVVLAAGWRACGLFLKGVSGVLHRFRCWSLFKSEQRDRVYLYGFPRLTVCPNPSAPCLKVETYLRLSGIPYVFVPLTSPDVSPHGRLPFIRLNGNSVTDSTHIIRFLERSGMGRSLDVAMTPHQRATSVAIQRLVEDSLRLHYGRWLTVDHFAHLCSFYAREAALPRWLIALMLRWERSKIIQMLNLVGQGDLTDEQYMEEFLHDVQSLESLLQSNYFFGASPCVLDCSVYAYLAQILLHVDSIPCEAALAVSRGPLRKFVQRMESAAFPEGLHEVCKRTGKGPSMQAQPHFVMR